MSLPLISYAQNFEDVMLWRALRDIAQGFYIDIGAHAPRIDSVSRLFYEHGWRGIHVEPLPVYCNALREDRPDETVIQAAVAEQTGVLRFFEIPDTGISTASPEIADAHRQRGFHINEIVVPSITLEQVFTQAQDKTIHWLKIDVEGLEDQVLKGWGNAVAKPWVVVVESTLPLTQQESYSEWEHHLTARGYSFAYFDGLNRFYLAAGQDDLRSAFNAGPNVFDGFSLSGQASATFCHAVQERLRNEHNQHAQQLINQSEQLHQQLTQLEQAAQTSHQQDGQREAELRQTQEAFAQLQQARQQEKEALAERERALGNLLMEARQQNHGETQALLQKLAQREQDFTQQLLQLQQKSQEVDQRQAQTQAELQQQIDSARSEQLRLEREQRSLANELAKKHDKAVQELRQQQAEQLNAATQLERELVSQLLQHQQRAQQATEAHAKATLELERSMARALAQRDQELQQQSKAAQKEAQRLALAWADKEKSLARQAAQAEQQAHGEKEDLLRAQAQREQEFTRQLLGTHEQAAQQAAEQARHHADQEHALHREHTEQQRALAQQLHAEQLELRRLQQDGAQRENAVHQEISVLQSEAQTLRHAQQLQAQQHGVEISAQQDEHKRLVQSYAALQTRLQAELLAEQQAALKIGQTLAGVQQALAATHATLSWRITAPLRKVAGLIAPGKPLVPTSPEMAKLEAPLADTLAAAAAAAAAPAPHVQPETVEPAINFSPSETTNMHPPAIATTLAELLALHDQRFVACAYQTLLGRAPDPEGLGYYLGRLRAGFSKTRVLAQLHLSAEGKAHATKLHGLDAAIQRHRRAQQPLIGWLFRLLDGTEGNHPTERKLRAIENQLFLLGDESNRRFNQMETALAGLHYLVVQQTQSVVAAMSGAHQTSLENATIIPVKPSEPDGLKQLPSRARNIYFQLKSAAANHVRRAA